MCEQEQNLGKEEPKAEAEFAMPDCCGPLMARMMKEFGPGSAGTEAVEAEPGGASVPSCCETMMTRMREACLKPSNGQVEESSSDEKGSGCCS